jgi:hypothetical protein
MTCLIFPLAGSSLQEAAAPEDCAAAGKLLHKYAKHAKTKGTKRKTDRNGFTEFFPPQEILESSVIAFERTSEGLATTRASP